MGSEDEPRPLRRLAASASMGVTAAGFAVMGLQEHFFASERWGLLGVAAMAGVAAVGLARRSVMPQILARGMAWVVLLPSAAGTLGSLYYGHLPELSTAVVAASSGAALLLGRAALNTPDAKREFSPIAYRRWFLAGAVSAVTAALVAAFGATGELIWGSARSGLGFTALAVVLLATAVGVVRMRAWGVLLGAASSLAMLGMAALSLNEFTTVASLFAALPGMILVSPLLVARLRPPAALPSSAAVARRRVEAMLASVEDEAPVVRARVAAPAEMDAMGEPAPAQARAR
jgi:hypothetical protein